jgi:hypothetical protein
MSKDPEKREAQLANLLNRNRKERINQTRKLGKGISERLLL